MVITKALSVKSWAISTKTLNYWRERMDRLLTDEDMRNIEAKVFRESQPNGEYFERDVKRAIRDKTDHLVAQEIIKEFEQEASGIDLDYVPDCDNVYVEGNLEDINALKPSDFIAIPKEVWEAIKSKWGIQSRILGG